MEDKMRETVVQEEDVICSECFYDIAVNEKAYLNAVEDYVCSECV